MKLKNYIAGQWVEGSGEGQMLYDASTGAEVAIASTEGIDLGTAFDFARNVGNPRLRKISLRGQGMM
ncbi:MAG: hypothetical protein U0V54_10125 [Saprospiraceae bacterium]